MYGEEQRLSPLLTFLAHPHCNHPAQVMVRDPWNHEKPGRDFSPDILGMERDLIGFLIHSLP